MEKRLSLTLFRAIIVLFSCAFSVGDDLGLFVAQCLDRLHPRKHRPHRKTYQQPYFYPESHIYYQLS